MSELKELSNDKYAYLCNLSMEELLELLAVAPIPAVSPEKEAYVDALKEAIIEKENENPIGFFPDIDQQWKQFETYYLPDMEDTVFEPERTEHAVSAQVNQQPLESPPKRVVRFSRVWCSALIAAVVIVCMFAVMVTAQATGVDVFGAMARWTKEVFSFGTIRGDDTEDNTSTEADQKTSQLGLEYTSLQEALDAFGVTEVSEPTWFPEEYTLTELNATYLDDSDLLSLSVTYSNGSDYLTMTIMSYENEPSTIVQKIDIPPETFEAGGITFYLIENTANYTVAWVTERYECYIDGVDQSTLQEMVYSMFN